MLPRSGPLLVISALATFSNLLAGCQPSGQPLGGEPVPELARPVTAEVRPPVPAHAEPDVFDHASVLGWSSDGKEVAVCVDSGCTESRRCEFHAPGRAEPERLMWSAGRGDPAAAKAALEKRLAGRQYGVTGPWSHSGKALMWRLDPPVPAPPAHEAALLAGIAAKSADPKTAPLSVRLGPGPGMHPELLAISPDGKHAAFVAHSLVMECGDQFHVAIVPIP